jgi:hypothetical protein
MINWHGQKVKTGCFGLALWLLASVYIGINTLPTHLTVDLTVDAADTAQLFDSLDGQWNEAESSASPLTPGWNRVLFTLHPRLSENGVRFDPGQRATTYRIHAISWERGWVQHAVPLEAVSDPRPPGIMSLTHAGDELVLTSKDNDAQTIIPAPDWHWQLAGLILPFGAPLVGLLLLLVAIRRVDNPVTIAGGFLLACAVFYAFSSVYLGPRMPIYDDWRYVFPGPFNLVDGGWKWLEVAGNDTYFLTNQVFDFILLNLSNVNFNSIRIFALVLLGMQLYAQWLIVTRLAATKPYAAAVAVALGFWSLASNGYWGATTIAYQQFLPTLFGTLMLAHLTGRDGEFKARHSNAFLVACCLASGLAYISGGLLIVSLGVACLLSVDVRNSPGGKRATSIFLALGSVLLVLQLILVWRVQGSLLDHNHAVPSVYPTDRRFWLFFFALYGRALGYAGHSAWINFALTSLTLFPSVLLGLERLLGSNRRAAARTLPMLELAVLYAGIGGATYAASVAFGRAGFVPVDFSATDLTFVSKGRFHYWPIAAMLPYAWLGWTVVTQRLGDTGAVALQVLTAVLLIVPKSLIPLAHVTYLLHTESLVKTGAHCALAQLSRSIDDKEVACPLFTGFPPNIGPYNVRTRGHLYSDLIEEGM